MMEVQTLRSWYDRPSRSGPLDHAANTTKSHRGHRAGYREISVVGAAELAEEATKGLPVVERRHFIIPGRRPRAILSTGSGMPTLYIFVF